MTFQGEDADQVIHEIGNVSALRGRTTLRNPIEMLKSHDMIDSESAGMTHIGADEIDEAGVSLVAQRMGIERGQTPVLPGRVENIRRRSDVRARDHKIRMRPGLRTRAV